MATASPMTNTVGMRWLERDAQKVWHGFTQMAAFKDNNPIVVDRAEGRELIDVDGRRYFDAISSLWLITLGHRVPELDAAVLRQLGKVSHSTLLGNSNRVVVELAEALSEVVPVDRPHFLFACDGASAVEQAIKIAFQYWVNSGVMERRKFLALGDAYHGDTIGGLSLGDSTFGSEVFDPLRFSALRSPGYADPNWLDAALEAVERHRSELVAVIVEPLVQAAAGVHISRIADFARFCAEVRAAGILLIVDEVATGFGRTGRLFACDHGDVEVDLLCLGKGITGGYLPMSATVASDRVFRAFLGEDLSSFAFYHGHSYGGNALAAAVALEHLRLIREPSLLEHVGEVASHLSDELAERISTHHLVRAVRQCGLFIGVELDANVGARGARQVAGGCVRRGILLRSLGDVIPIVPPLTTTRVEATRVIDVLAHSLDEFAGESGVLAEVGTFK